MSNDVAANDVTTDVQSEAPSDVNPSDVANGSTDIVKTVIQTPVTGYVTLTKHKAEFSVPIQGSARDIRNRLEVNDIVEFTITLTSGARKTVTGIIKAVGTLKGDEFVERCYSVAIFNSKTMEEKKLNYSSKYEDLKSHLCYRTNKDGEIVRDKSGKPMLVTIPVTPLSIMNVDTSYRKFLETLEDAKPTRTRTASATKSTNLSTLI